MQVAALDLDPGTARLFDGALQIEEETVTGHFEQTQARLAWSELEEGARAAATLQNFQLVVHHDGGRRITGQQKTVGFTLEFERHRENLGHARGRSRDVDQVDLPRRLPHRETEADSARDHSLTVDFLFLFDHVEQFRTRSQQTLGIADHKKSAGIQGIVKNGDNPLLQGLAQIDHNVAATHQVHAGKGRIAEDILRGENAEVADGFADLVTTVGLVEETAQAARADIGLDTFLVVGGAGALNRGFTEVGAEYLDGNVCGSVAKKFDQRDGVGVSLFAGGAARHPDADRGRGRAGFEQRWIDDLLENLEGVRVRGRKT